MFGQHPNAAASALTRRLSRRRALRGISGSAAIALTAQTALGGEHQLLADEIATPVASPATQPQTHDFELIAEEIDLELIPGTTVRAWAYNGQVPGPELRVREGDLVRVVLRNMLPVGTTIHWHGVNLPPAMDGPVGLNQAAVEPGATFVYEFVATPSGTRWYHSHADPALQVPLGLYGPLIIEPRTAESHVDREYTLVLGEWDLELTPAVAAGTASRGPRDQHLRGGELGSDLFLINGRMHGTDRPIRIAEGERILIRLINAGHHSHPFHTHGHSFTVVATDGNPVPEAARWRKDTIMISPGERYDLELIGDNPGIWMVHCHIEHHMANGMMTLLAYDGAKPSGPAAEIFNAPPDHDHGAPAGTVTPEPTVTQSTGEPTPSAPAENMAQIEMVDDRFVPSALTVPVNTTVTWINTGANWHSIAAFDGSFESGKLAPGETFSIHFATPGIYKYLCKHHAMQGMLATITVS